MQVICSNTTTDIKKTQGVSFRFLGGEGTSIELSSDTHAFRGSVPLGVGPSLAIVGEGYEAYEAFIDECLRMMNSPDLSGRKPSACCSMPQFLENGGKCPGDEDVVEVVNQFLKSLRNSVCAFTAYLPVVNLEVLAPLRMGKVDFLPTAQLGDEGRVKSENNAYVEPKMSKSGNAI